ncbi:hypothetical protein Godav_024720 [Gossypium davidsonii]|uniref:Retrotransposon gag domain-containing protein n=1 Tax=Gossypium davidsonii TaxID=34287 RepID=A0A7J8TFV1_GOSDV|nr:hypothetical protein [Gossypium davidsonii]
MENYFRAKGIVDEVVKVNTVSMFLTDITLLWWRGRTTNKRQCKIGTWQEFQCELKGQFYPEFIEEEARAKQEVEQRGVQKLSKTMTVKEAMVKLGLWKDKLGSSKSEENGVCEKDQMKDVVDGNGNDDSGGNRKPRVGKKKPKRKRDKLKCFFYDGPHMLKKCLKKFALKEKLIGKALVTGLSARGVEVREAESEKKPVECFLCHGPYRLRKCTRNSVIEGNDGADKEPKKLGLSKGKIEAKRAKKRKKKRVKCFLCRGPYELQNCPKQAVVKGKATSELGESSEGLPPKEEVGLSSDLEEKVVMKILKLGPMRLNFSEASKLTESLTRLPPMGEVGGALNFKGKEVMQVG